MSYFFNYQVNHMFGKGRSVFEEIILREFLKILLIGDSKILTFFKD